METFLPVAVATYLWDGVEHWFTLSCSWGSRGRRFKSCKPDAGQRHFPEFGRCLFRPVRPFVCPLDHRPSLCAPPSSHASATACRRAHHTDQPQNTRHHPRSHSVRHPDVDTTRGLSWIRTRSRRHGLDRSTSPRFGIVRSLKQPGRGLGINCSRHVLAQVDDDSRTPGDSKG
jgi:hypothetical protein